MRMHKKGHDKAFHNFVNEPKNERIIYLIAVIIPTYAQITSLLHTIAYMFRPFQQSTEGHTTQHEPRDTGQ
jgi:hypothetical protein